jgi:beta-glucosidase
MVGAQIAGVESNHVISTLKHFALNDQETDRNTANVIIDRAQAHMSDLLAFHIAIEQSDPGSVMCSYNKVWGDHACESAYLLTDVLRKNWGWKGYVMSDWGATHSTAKAALAGLEQQSGNPFDDIPHFGKPLLKAVESGELPEARLNQMAQRILRTLFAKGVIDHPVAIAPIDAEANARVSREGAEQGAVLLKNEGGVLPLKAGAARIVLIGGHADKGVLAGGGSSLVYPVGGNAVPGLKPTGWPGPVMYYPSSPLRAIQALAPGARVEFASGEDRAAAAKLAAGADVALVFVTQWTTESEDASLELADQQDALVAAVAAANPRTVVIVQSGGAVFMPWIDKVQGVLQAWYTGTRGGEAIANLLFGKVNPSGRLPVSFPRDASQFARAQLVEKDAAGKPTGEIHYKEGATVGYKWFDARQQKPLFPFGFGLSYTQFDYGDLKASVEGKNLTVSFKVTNTGKLAGQAVPQIYVANSANYWEAPKRLGGWKKVALAPGASSVVDLKVDPRLLAVFNAADNRWHLRKGTYEVLLGASSADLPQRASIQIAADAEWH